MNLGEVVIHMCNLQVHQVSSKSEEKQKSFIDSPFFSPEFQSVSRIVKIVHCEWMPWFFPKCLEKPVIEFWCKSYYLQDCNSQHIRFQSITFEDLK